MEMNWKKVLVSDWEAVKQLVAQGVAEDDKDATRLAFNSGIDMDMTDGLYNKYMKELIEAGKISMKILPLKKEHMQTYAHMEINEAQGHKDPSDHVIIAHAITEHLPLISSDTRFGFYRSQGLDLVFNQK